MTTTDQVSYATRRKLQEAGVPFDLIWDSQGLYLAHWFEHRMAGKGSSVGDACKAAGFSPDAVRQRRRYSPEFKAAEQYVRTGELYVDPASVVEEPQDVVPSRPDRHRHHVSPTTCTDRGSRSRATSRPR